MAMEIEKAGINLAAVYRPLNNPFLNIVMENIRKKYTGICKEIPLCRWIKILGGLSWCKYTKISTNGRIFG